MILPIFVVLLVHEEGTFMPSSSILIELMVHAIYSPLCKSAIFFLEKMSLIVSNVKLLSNFLKANCQAVDSSKKQKNEFVFTSMQRVFIRFLEEIEDFKKTFRNHLTFTMFFVQQNLI